MCVSGRDVNSVNAVGTLIVCAQTYLFQNPHLLHTTPGVTVTLKPGFD
jgi:hypothetical protein